MAETITTPRAAGGRFAPKAPKSQTLEERIAELRKLPARADIPLQIGVLVRELTTQTYGTVVARHEMLGGTVQYSVQPESTDGVTRADSHASDWQSLEVIGEGLMAKTSKPHPHDFNLGEEVKDTVTGFRGTLKELTTFANGCVYASITGKYKSTRTDSGAHDLFCTLVRLKKVGKGVLGMLPAHAFPPKGDEVAKPEPVAAPAPKADDSKAKAVRPPGGPSRPTSAIGRSDFRR